MGFPSTEAFVLFFFYNIEKRSGHSCFFYKQAEQILLIPQPHLQGPLGTLPGTASPASVPMAPCLGLSCRAGLRAPLMFAYKLGSEMISVISVCVPQPYVNVRPGQRFNKHCWSVLQGSFDQSGQTAKSHERKTKYREKRANWR